MRLPLRSAALIESWFDLLPAAQAAAARALQAAALNAVPELEQSIKWGNLVFSWHGSHALALVSHRHQIHLQCFRGAALAQRFPELEGSGRGLRHLRQRIGLPVDEALVGDLARATVEELRLEAEARSHA